MESSLALASSAGQGPFPVALAQVDRGCPYDFRVADAGTLGLFYDGDLLSCRSGRETSEIDSDFWTSDVVDLNIKRYTILKAKKITLKWHIFLLGIFCRNKSFVFIC